MLTVHASLNPQQEASTALSALLAEYQDKDILLLLSGGSAFTLLQTVDTSLLSERVTISVLDERHTQEASESNFAQLTTLPFFTQAKARGTSFINPRPLPEETPAQCAKRFDLALKQWDILHRDGIVLATLGIGADGHTAGILPFPEDKETFEKLFLDPTQCAVGYTIPHTSENPFKERVTATGSYLTRHIHHALIFVAGKEKAPVLERIKENTGSVWETPALLVHTMKDVQLYTDLSL